MTKVDSPFFYGMKIISNEIISYWKSEVRHYICIYRKNNNISTVLSVNNMTAVIIVSRYVNNSKGLNEIDAKRH